MAVTENILSVALVVIAIYLGIKIIKNILVTVVMVAALVVILYYLGYIPQVFGAVPKLF
jgi:hypothetical protein